MKDLCIESYLLGGVIFIISWIIAGYIAKKLKEE